MYSIFSGNKLIKAQATEIEVMDAIWDCELNTEDHPVHIYDENGREVEW